MTFFAGTFVRHPLTLAAVKAVLRHLKREGPALQERLTKRTAELVARINAVFERVTRIRAAGSIHPPAFMYFNVPVRRRRYASLFYYLLREQGVHILEGFPCFLTTAHTDADLDRWWSTPLSSRRSEMRQSGFILTPTAPSDAMPGAAPVAAPVSPLSVTMLNPSRSARRRLRIVIRPSRNGKSSWRQCWAMMLSCAFNESISAALRRSAGSLRACSV